MTKAPGTDGEVLILHNPRCSTSRAALATCEQSEFSGDATIRNYLVDPLSEREWLDVLAILEDPPSDLVRRDKNFDAAGLTDDDVATPAQIAKVLAADPILAQRPVLIRGGRAIIGRPKDRVPEFLS